MEELLAQLAVETASLPFVERLERHPNVSRLIKSGALDKPYFYVYSGRKWQSSICRRSLSENFCVTIKGFGTFSHHELAGTSVCIERYHLSDSLSLCRVVKSGAADWNGDSSSLRDAFGSLSVSVLRKCEVRDRSLSTTGLTDTSHDVSSDDHELERVDPVQMAVSDMLQRQSDYAVNTPEGWKRWCVGELAYMQRDSIVHSMDEITDYVVGSKQAFFLAVSLLDRYVCVAEVRADSTFFQVLVVSAVFVACKTEDVFPPKVDQMLSALGDKHGVDADTFLKMELHLLSTLGFRVNPVTTDEVVQFLIHSCGHKGTQLESLCNMLSEMCVRDAAGQTHRPCAIGWAVVKYASTILGCPIDETLSACCSLSDGDEWAEHVFAVHQTGLSSVALKPVTDRYNACQRHFVGLIAPPSVSPDDVVIEYM